MNGFNGIQILNFISKIMWLYEDRVGKKHIS
jgi:hypothetical protein